MWETTSTFADEVKDTCDSRRDTVERLRDEMTVCVLNFIESCMFYIYAYPVVFLYLYVFLIIYVYYWIYSESTMWYNFSDKRPPRRRDRPRLRKKLRYKRGKHESYSSVSEQLKQSGPWYVKRKD